MEAITSMAQLNARIAVLEIERTNEEILLRAQLKTSFEGLKPINLIKSSIQDIITTPNFKGNIINTVLSYATGYIAKKVVVGSTYNPIKQILGLVLQTGVTNVVSKNAGNIKSLLFSFINKNRKH